MLYIIITVDVEVHEKYISNDPSYEINNMIYGSFYGKYYGFPKIMELCAKHGVLATFFLDVLEYKRYGESQLIKICDLIKSSGFDLQLHIHPARGYDPKRLSLWQYSLQEQIKIIEDCKKLMVKWTREAPIAFRGGHFYGIDKNTFLALRFNDIPIDSTSFYGHPNCRSVITKNSIVEYESIIEVPVTVFRRVRCITMGNLKLKQLSRFSKTDIDSATLYELKSFINQSEEYNIRVLNLFLHSHSFLKFAHHFRHFRADFSDIEKMDALLEFILNERKAKVITLKQFYEMYRENPKQFMGTEDQIPIIKQNEPLNPFIHGIKLAKYFIRNNSKYFKPGLSHK